MDDYFQTIGFIGYGKFTRLLIELFSQNMPQSKLKVLSRSHQPDGITFFSKEDVVFDFGWESGFIHQN